MNEIEYMQNLTRGRLLWWIEKHEKPDWYDWLGLYPARASVEAAKAQLKAMDEFGLLIDVKDSCGIFDV